MMKEDCGGGVVMVRRLGEEIGEGRGRLGRFGRMVGGRGRDSSGENI